MAALRVRGRDGRVYWQEHDKILLWRGRRQSQLGELGRAYEAPYGWLDSGGYRVCGPNRELLLQLGGDGAAAVTELQLPVEPKPFLCRVAKRKETTAMNVTIEKKPAFTAVGPSYFGTNEEDEFPTLWEALNHRRAGEVAGRAGPAFGLCGPVEGASPKAGSYLRQAVKNNPHVPAYILGPKRIPKDQPDYIGWGDETEAAYVAAEVKDIWWREEGAIRWLRENVT